MPDVDTSSYGAPTPPNPLQTLGNAAAIQNALNQNRLFQQQYNTNLAVSNIYKNAVDPNTGQIDPVKLRSLLASDPNASYGLPAAFQGSQEAQQRNLTISQQQLDLAKSHLDGLLTKYINPLAQNPNATSRDVAGAIGQAMASGISDPQTATQIWSTIPRDQNGNIIESQVPGWIKSQRMRVLSAQEQLNAMSPAPTIVNTGNQMVPYRLPQVGSPSVAGPSIPVQPSPTTQVYNPVTHQMEYVGNIPGGSNGRSAGFAPGIAAAPPLGAGAAADVAAAGSAKSYQNLRDDVQGSSQRVFQLNKALTGIQGTNTGPGSEAVNNIKSFLLSHVGEMKSLGVNPNSIKNYDEAVKYLTAYASGAAGNFSPHTDSQLATALSANASTHISNLAAQDVIKANIGLERMKQAEAIAFQQSGQPPGAFSDWAVNWNRSNDPRAFIVDQMPSKDRVKMIDGMKPAEKKNFVNSMRQALQTGVISLSDLPQ